MGKIIKFKQNPQYYLEMSEKYSEEEDYISAISNLRYGLRFSESNEDSEELLLTMAEKYAEMGRFDDSNEVFFDLLSKDMAKSDCYFGLAQNFFCLENHDLATYYLGLLTDAEDELSLDDLSGVFEGLPQTFEETPSTANGYRVVYPVGEESHENARRLMAIGKVDEAMAILSMAKENSKEYVPILNDLTMCYMLKEEYDMAMEVTQKALKKEPDNVTSLCSLAVLYKIKRNMPQADEVIDKILQLKVESGIEASRVASTMCEFGRHEEAERLLKIAVDEKKYLDTFLLLLGLAQYNQQKFDEAVQTFDKMLKMSPNSSIVKFYMRVTKKAISAKEKGKLKFKPLTYLPQIPYDEIVSRFLILEEMANARDFSNLEDETHIENEYFWWLMETTESDLQLYYIDRLIESDIANKTEILKKLLLLSQVSRPVKSKAYLGLMQENATKISFVDKGKFDQVKCAYPKRYKLFNQILKKSFCLAASMLVFFSKEDLVSLKRVADDAYLVLSQKDDVMRSEKALAIVLIMRTNQKVFSKEILCKIMSVTKQTLKRYEQILISDN